MHRTQLADNLARRIVDKGSESVHVVHSEIEGSVIAPGQLAVGFVAFDVPRSEGPTVLQLIFPMDRGLAVTATMVL
jgi:hypothetical protein